MDFALYSETHRNSGRRQYAIMRSNERLGIYANQPALVFERLTGLNGIGKAWNMPDDLPAHIVERRTVRRFHSLNNLRTENGADSTFTKTKAGQDILKTYGRLVGLNPELKTLGDASTNVRKAYDVVLGATSGFNIDDMRYFQNVPVEKRDSALDRRVDNITLRSKERPYWIMSPETIKAVENQLDADPRFPSKVIDPERTLGKLGTVTMAVNIVDEVAKGQYVQAAAYAGGAVGISYVARQVPIVNQVTGIGFAGADAFSAYQQEHYGRMAFSGTEAALYGTSGVALAATPAFPPAAAVATVAGVAAVGMTTARAFYDSVGVVGDWLGHDPSERLTKQREIMKKIDATLPTSTEGVSDPVIRDLIIQRQEIDKMRESLGNDHASRGQAQLINQAEEQRTRTFFNQVYLERAKMADTFDKQLPTDTSSITDPKIKALADERNAMSEAQKQSEKAKTSNPGSGRGLRDKQMIVARADDLRIQHIDNVWGYLKDEQNQTAKTAQTNTASPPNGDESKEAPTNAYQGRNPNYQSISTTKTTDAGSGSTHTPPHTAAQTDPTHAWLLKSDSMCYI